jgi:hypothetical protein
MLIRSHSSAWRLAEVDPATGRIFVLPIWRTWTRRNEKTSGWFGRFGNDLVAIYSHRGLLYLTLGSGGVPFESVIVEYSSHDTTHKRLRLRQGDEGLLTAEYTAGRAQFSGDTTAGLEPEQFDFGLFLYNLSNDPARVGRLAAV